MKQLATLFLLLTVISIHAQTPEKMSYQTVVWDADNTLLANTTVGIQLSILQGNASGTAVYIETHTPTTNQNGLVSLEIGTGTITSGNITTIDWNNGPYFIKTETDITGGTNYTITTTNQLLSVPYALHAKTATTVTTPTLMEPYILGTTFHTDDGTYQYGGLTGWQAANEVCKLAYPNEPYARAFTAEQITQAIILGNYSSNTNYDNVPFWVITSSITKGVFDGSGFNNSQNLSENAGDVSRGVRGIIKFNYTSIGNGGGPTIPRFFNVEQDIMNNNSIPCLCGTYVPAN
ncbi:hypothetical protein [Mangrovimonas spongiae]|uniref:Uncharacterized protein n=1 Tax=Mangrovimonas spongiae TaxID=2494697 RepID=A0A428JYV8_9FLAO|nr:hypothetical protein [Mangrovimonas spongiae]RSK39308.1 hypothetical protein EJA19_10290 [Mangrovimonas spongiae]